MRGVHAEPAHGARLDPPTQHHGPVPAALPALQGHRQDSATGRATGGTTLLCWKVALKYVCTCEVKLKNIYSLVETVNVKVRIVFGTF